MAKFTKLIKHAYLYLTKFRPSKLSRSSLHVSVGKKFQVINKIKVLLRAYFSILRNGQVSSDTSTQSKSATYSKCVKSFSLKTADFCRTEQYQ